MNYRMRFLVTDEEPLEFAQLASGLSAEDASYQLGAGKSPAAGKLRLSGKPIADVEVLRVADPDGAAELARLQTAVEAHSNEEARTQVLAEFKAVRTIVRVTVTLADEDIDEALETLDLVWEWLFARAGGLLQADLEGYYDDFGCLLEFE